MAQILCPVMIGRDAELEAVDAALTAAVAGHGGCVVITGEPGIGKSRLALETASRAASRGIRVVTSRAVPQSATAAYRPLSDALMQLLRDRPLPADVAMEPWRPALDAMLLATTMRWLMILVSLAGLVWLATVLIGHRLRRPEDVSP